MLKRVCQEVHEKDTKWGVGRSKEKDRGRARGAGVIVISDEDGMYLLALCQQNNKRTLQDYCIWLIEDRGVFVSPSVICKWFLNSFPFRGSLGKLNQVLSSARRISFVLWSTGNSSGRWILTG